MTATYTMFLEMLEMYDVPVHNTKLEYILPTGVHVITLNFYNTPKYISI
jgi:hypothetical protein